MRRWLRTVRSVWQQYLSRLSSSFLPAPSPVLLPATVRPYRPACMAIHPETIARKRQMFAAQTLSFLSNLPNQPPDHLPVHPASQPQSAPQSAPQSQSLPLPQPLSNAVRLPVRPPSPSPAPVVPGLRGQVATPDELPDVTAAHIQELEQARRIRDAFAILDAEVSAFALAAQPSNRRRIFHTDRPSNTRHMPRVPRRHSSSQEG